MQQSTVVELGLVEAPTDFLGQHIQLLHEGGVVQQVRDNRWRIKPKKTFYSWLAGRSKSGSSCSASWP